MEPTIFHGDVIALKKVHSFTHIEWGEIYVVTSYADRDLCAVKCIHQNQGDNNTILLRSLNPAFAGDTVVYKQDIHTIYKVIGLVRML